MQTFLKVKELRERILWTLDHDNVPMVLIGNKCDLENQREVSREAAEVCFASHHIGDTHSQNFFYFDKGTSKRIQMPFLWDVRKDSSECCRCSRNVDMGDSKERRRKLIVRDTPQKQHKQKTHCIYTPPSFLNFPFTRSNQTQKTYKPTRTKEEKTNKQESEKRTQTLLYIILFLKTTKTTKEQQIKNGRKIKTNKGETECVRYSRMYHS